MSPTEHHSQTTGDRTAAPQLDAVFAACRPRLLRTVQLHLDARLLSRIDPDDVVQECFLLAQRRPESRTIADATQMFVWLRLLARQLTVDLARRHLGAKARAVGREQALEPLPHADTAAALERGLLSRLTSPTQAAARAELGERLAAAIAGMSEQDREILLLRHFEELTNGEAAAVLGIHKAAATNRYLRALRRLKELLPDDLGGRS